MTRTLILIIGLIIASVSFSQTDRAAENSDKLIQLKLKNEQVTRKIVDLEALILVLKGELQNTKEEVKSELIRGQELQAQNESSLNIALDEFSKKFEQQNETVKGVQDELNRKFDNQMIMLVVGFIVLLFIFMILSKRATQKALKQNVANWNNFQEHLLKK
jgi:predicted RNase H-like nuclease (RuvC/YqgF family)